MTTEIDVTGSKEYGPLVRDMEQRAGISGGRLIRYTKQHKTHPNQFRYRTAGKGLNSVGLRLKRPHKIDTNGFTKRSYMHDKPQLGEGDFYQSPRIPLSIFNTADGKFIVEGLVSNKYGGNIIQIRFIHPETFKYRTVSFSHLLDRFPEDILKSLQIDKPRELECGEVFGYIGWTGNLGVWMTKGKFNPPDPHTHIAGLELAKKELAPWAKRVLAIPEKQKVPWKRGW